MFWICYYEFELEVDIEMRSQPRELEVEVLRVDQRGVASESKSDEGHVGVIEEYGIVRITLSVEHICFLDGAGVYLTLIEVLQQIRCVTCWCLHCC